MIIKNLFKKETNLSIFFGKKVQIQNPEYNFTGEIFTNFGNSGKVKVRFNENLNSIKEILKNLKVSMKIEKIIKI